MEDDTYSPELFSSPQHDAAEAMTEEGFDASFALQEDNFGNDEQQAGEMAQNNSQGNGSDEQIIIQHHPAEKSPDNSSGSVPPKKSLTDTEAFTSSTKESINADKWSNDDEKSINEDNNDDGNDASASSSDSEGTDDETRRDERENRKRRHHDNPQQQHAMAFPVQGEIIDLLGNDDDQDTEKTDTSDGGQQQQSKKPRSSQGPSGYTGDPNAAAQNLGSAQLAQNIEQIYRPAAAAAASSSSSSGTARMHVPPRVGQPIQPGASIPGANVFENRIQQSIGSNNGSVNRGRVNSYDTPMYLPANSASPPTWMTMFPTLSAVRKAPPPNGANKRRFFRLSLLNVNEFTITGLQPTWDSPATPLTNLRTAIRQTSREHGKAVFERDKEGDGGKWRIPLGAYQAFLSFLTGDPYTRVEGIPQHQLQIASLERARQEKGYPTPEEVIEMGVPAGLARALAPFQRGGVDFVNEKQGRALIADDMGLGKVRKLCA